MQTKEEVSKEIKALSVTLAKLQAHYDSLNEKDKKAQEDDLNGGRK